MKIRRVVKELPVVGLVPFSGKKAIDRKSGVDNQFYSIQRDGITQSMIASFLQCPTKCFNKYILGLDSGSFNHALDFGSLFHEILDKVYSRYIGATKIKPTDWQNTASVTLDETYGTVVKDIDSSDLQKYELTHGLCSLVLSRYFDWWQKEDSSSKIIAVEKEFAFPYKLRDGTTILIRGKIDRLDEINGEYWLFETKTKSSIDMTAGYSCNGVVESMGYQLQVMVYCMAVFYMYGKYPKGVIYNLVKRPQQKYSGTYYKKPETLPQFLDRVEKDMEEKCDAKSRTNEYFLRYHISLTNKEIEDYKLMDFDHIIERIYEWSEYRRPAFKNSANCFMFRKPCEFLKLCSGATSKEEFDTRKTIFPELSVKVDYDYD